METKNKKAIVTGGTRGIGRAIVKELATNTNYKGVLSDVVFIYNKSDEAAQQLVKELENSQTKVFAIKADVASFEETQRAISEAIEKLGGIDFLINNAGITRDTLLLRMSEKDFDDVIDANLKSVFNCTKAVLKNLISQRSGRIVNISSVVALIGNPGQANYVASKAGVIGFTKSVAREVASRGITVNAIAPGFIKSDMTDKLTDEQKQKLVQNIPLGKIGTPENIAKMVAFLCSDDAEYITGQVFAVDGGLTM
ncbi:MAG: 3-oxoacyl-[acyl-carrier-protein] reductase [Ignavibacterium sp.]|jgi:3-oxoacyl-[acyl-carrier protein] reductase|uniref:3-oxoacyl-[acyl-carrier-protein] reductase n=1 Tax=Ignavibacterium sp. TaxID=2651167 RepID=UPI0032971CF8